MIIITSRKKIFFVLVLLLSLGGCATQTNTEGSNIQEPIVRNTYPIPNKGNDVIGQSAQIRAKKGMTFDQLAQRYDIGAQELMDANPRIKPYAIPVGAKITIPTEYILPPEQDRKGIVINLAEMRLYYFDKNNNTVMTFPVAVGRDGWNTPLGKTYVYRKEEAPVWNVPKSIRDEYFKKTGLEHPLRIEAGSDNPLGDYAIYLHMDGYLIHGTNSPASIGRRVSSGCIRMFNGDVSELFKYVKRGTPVNILYDPNKVGWRDGKLYLEVHSVSPAKNENVSSDTVSEMISSALNGHSANIDWTAVKKVINAHNGIPTQIGVENG